MTQLLVGQCWAVGERLLVTLQPTGLESCFLVPLLDPDKGDVRKATVGQVNSTFLIVHNYYNLYLNTLKESSRHCHYLLYLSQ